MKPKYLALSTVVAIAAVCATLVAGAARASSASLPATQICDQMSTALDVNDSGTVAGYTGSWPNVRAVTCSSANVLKYLDLPGDASGSIAVAINSGGQVAGQVNLSSGQEAVVWDSSGAITRLGFLPGGPSFSSAQDINDNGWVVGVTSSGGLYLGFVWDGSGPIEALPMPSGMTSAFAQAINNDGTIAGSASAMYVAGIAVVWKDGVATALPPLADGATASATDINDAGQVVGNSATTAPPWLVRHPVLWDDGTALDLGSLGGSFGLAVAIDADGRVAGYMTDAGDVYHGFLWENGTTTLLDPLDGDLHSVPSGMNGNGEIVGNSSETLYGVGRAVRWTQAGDSTPPELTVSVSPSLLWPPTHKYVEVQATVTAADDTDPSPNIELISVTSNEPENGEGDGNTADDIVIVDDYTFQLRAERNEYATGRIYTITYTATDANGNTSEPQSATVTVPITR